MTDFKMFEAFSAAPVSARGNETQYFCFIIKIMWNFLCCQLSCFLSTAGVPKCEQKWGTWLGSHFGNYVLICTAKKRTLPYLFIFPALFTEDIVLQQTGLPLTIHFLGTMIGIFWKSARQDFYKTRSPLD
jgi:hypothetical protein